MAGARSGPSPSRRPTLFARTDPLQKPSPATTNTAGAPDAGGDVMNDTRDKVIAVEVGMRHMVERVDALEREMETGFAAVRSDIKQIDTKVDELTTALKAERDERKTRDRITVLGLRIGRWAALSLAGLVGWAIGNLDTIAAMWKAAIGP